MLYYLFNYLHTEFNLPGTGAFQYITFRAGLAIILSLVISLVFGKRLIDILRGKQAAETIRQLGLEGENTKKGTPTMGGLIILGATLIPTLLFARLVNVYVILMIVTTVWLGLIGFLDDYIKTYKKNKEGLAGRFKIVGQIGIGIIVGATLYFHHSVVIRETYSEKEATAEIIASATPVKLDNGKTIYTRDVKSTLTTVPFVKSHEFNYSRLLFFLEDETARKYTWIVFILVVIFIITAVSNGANLTDGIDGLAAGSSAIIGATLALLAFISGNIIFADYLNIMYLPNQGELTIFLASFVGACIGFLWYNSYPAQVFMGDTGSLAIGGIIAVIAIILRKELLIPILCGIFLVENLSVVLQVSYFKYTKKRFGEGRRIFKMAPLHHHFQKAGYAEPKIVTRFWIVGIMLAILTIITFKNEIVKMAKRLVILGAGESGCGTALLGLTKGYDTFVSDFGKIKPKYSDELSEMGVEWESEKHTEAKILNADIIVKSPGIPEKSPIIKKALEAGIKIVSEIEFAAGYTDAKLIGITGTNGKTTTTLLIHHILKNAGINVGLGGNIGKSFARQVANSNYDHYVLELSSFQLDGMFESRINQAVLTNITPDHLDRYDYKLENYINSKFRITQNQDETDQFIYCDDDALTTQNLNLNKGNGQMLAFSINHEVQNGAFLSGNEIIVRQTKQNKEFIMPINQLTISGKHNIYNSMAAAIVVNSFEIRNDNVRKSFSDFQNVEHRMEWVGKIKGVEFINDSKATNVNSAWFALESMETPVVWIVGGTDKGNDYSMLQELVKEKVRVIVCMGLDNSKIHQAFGNDVELIINTTSAVEAVNAAYSFAKNGDTVLLSPACASFDLFNDYEDRGNQFKLAVKAL